MSGALLFTVPSTGTFFTKRFLVALGGLDVRHEIEDPDLVDVSLWHSHPDVLKIDKFTRAIIPLRHPYQNAMSQIVDNPPAIERCVRYWRCMVETEPTFNEKVFLPLDTDSRYQTLLRVAEFVDRVNVPVIQEWATKWPVINHRVEANKKEPLLKSQRDQLEFAVEWYERCLTSQRQSL